MSNEEVRKLVASVTQDAQSETVDMIESKCSVHECAQKITDVGLARRQIISWLNLVFFTNQQSTIDSHWWFEMHTRIQKLLIVSMVLEGDNLRGFDCTPEESDIPQCLVHLQNHLNNLRKDVFPKMREDFKKRVERLDTDYVNLYVMKE